MLSLNIKNISLKRNEKTTIILSNVNFVTKKGERLVITGRNGSGKTTLLKAIADLLGKNYTIEGEIKIENTELKKLKGSERADFRKKHVGIIFQDPFSSLDPLKKLGYYTKFPGSHNKLTLYLDKLGFSHSKKINNLLPFELSIGMAQKFQIALNFAMDKSIYLLDEPTSALDYLSIDKFNDLLNEMTDLGKTLVLVTQDKDFAHGFSNNIKDLD